jgi:hypothetical protein
MPIRTQYMPTVKCLFMGISCLPAGRHLPAIVLWQAGLTDLIKNKKITR